MNAKRQTTWPWLQSSRPANGGFWQKGREEVGKQQARYKSVPASFHTNLIQNSYKFHPNENNTTDNDEWMWCLWCLKYLWGGNSRTTKINDTCRWGRDPGSRTQEGQRCDQKPENINHVKEKLKFMMMLVTSCLCLWWWWQCPWWWWRPEWRPEWRLEWRRKWWINDNLLQV